MARTESENSGLLLTLDRGIRVLEEIAHSDGRATAKTLSASLEINLGTTYQLLRTLQANGYVNRRAGGRYQLGARIGFLIDHYKRQGNFEDVVRLLVVRLGILDQADELARRFEEYEPSEGDERPVEEYLLSRAALARARSERQIVDAVVAARKAGISWARIGELLGTSAQAAQQRYRAVVEQV